MLWIPALLLFVQEPPEKEPPIPPPPPRRAPEVVVTATRYGIDPVESPFALEGIGRDEIETQNADTVGEILRGAAGTHFVLTGTRGMVSSLFTRGTESNHTLILLDGFKLNEDGDTFFQYDLLAPRSLEAVEILRGPASAVYGAGAVGGVVQLFTEPGSGSPRATAGAQYGSFETNREYVDVIGQSGPVTYHGVGTRLDQNRLRLRGDRIPNSEVDAYDAVARVDLALAERAGIKLIGRYLDSRVEGYANDAGILLQPPDPNSWVGNRGWLVGTEVWAAPGTALELSLRLSRYQRDQEFEDLPDANETSTIRSEIRYVRYNVQPSATLHVGRFDTITAGLDSQTETYDLDSVGTFPSEIDEFRQAAGAYVHNELRIHEFIFFHSGIRYDDYPGFHRGWTGRVAGAVLVRRTMTKLRVGAGTAFVVPSFTELFFPGFGNPALDEERSTTAEVGADQWLFDRSLRLSATAFWIWTRDLIAGFPPENLNRAYSRGVEVEAEWRVPGADGLAVRGQYTYTWAWDPQADDFLLRRPVHGGRVGATWRTDAFGVSVDAVFVGEREDMNFATFAREELPPYAKVDAGGFVSLFSEARLTIRVENVLDRKYEETRGFPAAGVNALLGIEVGAQVP